MQNSIKPIANNWTHSIKEIAAEISTLQGLTTAHRFDNTAISESARKVRSACQNLQKSLRLADQFIQKESKRNLVKAG